MRFELTMGLLHWITIPVRSTATGTPAYTKLLKKCAALPTELFRHLLLLYINRQSNKKLFIQELPHILANLQYHINLAAQVQQLHLQLFGILSVQFHLVLLLRP